MIARLDQPELLARDRLDRRVGPRLLDLLLHAQVLGAQPGDLGAQRVRFLVQSVVLDSLLSGGDKGVQQQRHDQHRGDAQCERRRTDWPPNHDRIIHCSCAPRLGQLDAPLQCRMRRQ